MISATNIIKRILFCCVEKMNGFINGTNSFLMFSKKSYRQKGNSSLDLKLMKRCERQLSTTGEHTPRHGSDFRRYVAAEMQRRLDNVICSKRTTGASARLARLVEPRKPLSTTRRINMVARSEHFKVVVLYSSISTKTSVG